MIDIDGRINEESLLQVLSCVQVKQLSQFQKNENAENESVDQSQAWGTDTKTISLCVQCSELCAPPLTQCRKGQCC